MRTTDTRMNNWRRAIPKEDPEVARLLAMCTALTSELTVVRERLDTIERLAAAKGLLSQAEIEAYEPDAPATSERDGIRRRILQRVFRPFKADAEREAKAIRTKVERAAAKAAVRETA